MEEWPSTASFMATTVDVLFSWEFRGIRKKRESIWQKGRRKSVERRKTNLTWERQSWKLFTGWKRQQNVCRIALIATWSQRVWSLLTWHITSRAQKNGFLSFRRAVWTLRKWWKRWRGFISTWRKGTKKGFIGKSERRREREALVRASDIKIGRMILSENESGYEWYCSVEWNN